MKKIKLTALKVESFVTQLTEKNELTIQGGLVGMGHGGGSMGEGDCRPHIPFSAWQTCPINCENPPPTGLCATAPTSPCGCPLPSPPPVVK